MTLILEAEQSAVRLRVETAHRFDPIVDGEEPSPSTIGSKRRAVAIAVLTEEHNCHGHCSHLSVAPSTPVLVLCVERHPRSRPPIASSTAPCANPLTLPLCVYCHLHRTATVLRIPTPARHFTAVDRLRGARRRPLRSCQLYAERCTVPLYAGVAYLATISLTTPFKLYLKYPRT